MDIIAIAERFDVDVKDFEDGVLQIQDLESKVGSVITGIREHQINLCLIRFQEGAIINAICEKTSSKRGDTTNTIRMISEQTGVTEAIIWDCRRLYNRPEWGGSLDALRQWLKEKEGGASWTHLRYWMNNQRRKSEHGYFSNKIESLEKRAMRLEEDALQLDEELDMYARGQQLLAGKGIVNKIREIKQDGFGRAKDLLDDYRHRPPRSQEYLAFIRELPCCVSGLKEDVIAHHVLTHGKSVKCSDYATVPLNHLIHAELHSIGKKTFEEKYSINFWEEIAQCLSIFFVGRQLK